MPYVKTFMGDSLDVDIPDSTVRLIMTSPPYADRRKKTYGGIHPDKYVEWFIPHAERWMDILADDGSLVINIKENVVDGERHTYVLELIMAMRSLGWRWVEEYCWHKTTCAPGKWPNRFRDSFERCLHFTKQKKFVMNQDDVMVPTGDWQKKRMKNLSEKDKIRVTSATGSGTGKNISNWKDRTMAYPSNVLYGSPVTKNYGHSAVYPLWLPEWFIKLFSNEGDIVYDPFAGSGTTGIAAYENNRDAILAECDPAAYKSLEERMDQQGIVISSL